jgi:hypothetical protein
MRLEFVRSPNEIGKKPDDLQLVMSVMPRKVFSKPSERRSIAYVEPSTYRDTKRSMVILHHNGNPRKTGAWGRD